jgi:O-antigen/teichoic acid export membrane protein
VNILQPWRPQLVFDWQRVKHTLGFGLSFQGSNAVAFLNGAIAPLLAGIRLGPSGLGLVQFAQNTAWFPTAFVGVVRRVAFPYLSRLQGEPRAFARAFDRAILSCAIPVFFFLGLFFGAAPHIVELIYSEKWLPAVPALYVYSVGITINFFAWIGSAALEALGKPKRLLRIVALSTTVNWIACLIAVFVSPTPFSFAIGFCTHMILGSGGMYLAIRELVPEVRPLRCVRGLLPAALLIAVGGRLVFAWTSTLFGLLSYGLLAALLFGGTAAALDREVRSVFAEQLRSLKRFVRR